MKKGEKGLSAWQLTMMALGSVIGGSFFLGSSVAVQAAGPSVLLSFIIGGVLVYFILFALSEMTVSNISVGSFRTFAAQAFGEGTGFVVGWVYWTGMSLAMSSEATAVSILIREWFPRISISVLGSIIIIGVTLLNLLGATKLSQLESGLSIVKLFTIVSFIIIGVLLMVGLFPGNNAIGLGELTREPLLPNGIRGIAGSMLLVMFSYAGFEVIGLAASEADNPKETIPKAIKYTVFCLLFFYIISNFVLLTLIPTASLTTDISPMVLALNSLGIGWAGTVINIVLITAILSTMLASMFGLGRMIRSLVDDGLAPKFLKDKSDVPYRGILFSGLAMLIGLGLGLLLPSVYIFLMSSGGFALLITYAVIMATHIHYRKTNGAPTDGRCQLRGFPYSSLFVLIALVIAIISMPFVKGQGIGLLAGILMVAFYMISYIIMRFMRNSQKHQSFYNNANVGNNRLSTEFSNELTHLDNKKSSNYQDGIDTTNNNVQKETNSLLNKNIKEESACIIKENAKEGIIGVNLKGKIENLSNDSNQNKQEEPSKDK